MNSLQMLEMYLQDYDISCSIINANRYSWWPIERKDCHDLRVHLKHKLVNDTIDLSIAYVSICIKGTNIYGRPGSRSGSKPAIQNIADLIDPQAFEKVRMWIRYEEKRVRNSIKFKDIEIRSRRKSLYDCGSQKVRVAINADDIYLLSKTTNLEVDDVVDDVGPTQKPYEIPVEYQKKD